MIFMHSQKQALMGLRAAGAGLRFAGAIDHIADFFSHPNPFPRSSSAVPLFYGGMGFHPSPLGFEKFIRPPSRPLG
jgi:hypothetical protein